jgi:cytochrome c oxidase assembly factor CtaG
LISISALALQEVAHAHRAAASNADERMWNFITSITLATVGVLYAIGLLRLWKTNGGRTSVRPWQAVAFVAGLLSAGGSLLSQLDRWSDTLFSAHMTQHEILMLVAAPLMVIGRPFIVMLWSLPPGGRALVADQIRRPQILTTWEKLTAPFAVFLLHTVVLWGWHIPALFEAALHHEALHVFQHLGFFVTAALFWWTLIHGRFGRIGYGAAVVYVFAIAMQSELLGALLTFGHKILYPTHALRTGADALQDQQLAGIVMWIPFGVIFVLIGLALFAAWLGEAERRVALSSADALAAREAQ